MDVDWNLKKYSNKECLLQLVVFGVERDVDKEYGRCFLHHFLRHTMLVFVSHTSISMRVYAYGDFH